MIRVDLCMQEKNKNEGGRKGRKEGEKEKENLR
jgi:hypothetical protein